MRFILLDKGEVVVRTFVVLFFTDTNGFTSQVSGYYKYRVRDRIEGFSDRLPVREGLSFDKRNLSLRINPSNHARKFPGVRSNGQFENGRAVYEDASEPDSGSRE